MDVADVTVSTAPGTTEGTYYEYPMTVDTTEDYRYVYNGSQLSLLTISTNSETTTTLYFAYDASGFPMALTYNGTTYYYVTNLQGDVTAILNSRGTAVVEYTYAAWGKILTTSGTMSDTLGEHNPLRYRGYVYDTETGLYYLQSRYYDPEMGRFINADSLVSTGQGILGNNMFAYCGNNPANYLDSSGESETAALQEGANWLLGLLMLLDGGTPFLEAAAVIASVVAVGVIVTGSVSGYERDEIKSEAIAQAKVAEPESPALYFGVDLYGGQMRVVTGPMLFDDAADWARIIAATNVYPNRAAWGLYTQEYDDARAMAIYLGSVPGLISFDEARRNHLPHFHTAGRDILGVYAPNFHVWYSV